MAKATWIVIGVLGALALLLIGIVGSAVGTYNSLTDESVGIDAQSKQVDVQYQRAFRLIPQIETLADKYIDKTTEAYERVVAMRTRAAAAEASGNLTAKDEAAQDVRTTFNFMVEAYPDIRSDEIYGTVLDEMINTENKIAAEKTRYNDRVQEYNAHRRRCCLPAIVAGMFGFDEREFIGYNDRPNTSSFGNNTL